MGSALEGTNVKIVNVIGGWVAVLRRIEPGRVLWDVQTVGEPNAALLDCAGFRTRGSALRYAVQVAGNTLAVGAA